MLDKSALYSPSPERSEEELKLAQQLSMQNGDEGIRERKHRFKLPALLLRWMGILAPARL